MKQKRKRRLWMLAIILILLGIVFVVGRSFGFFTYRKSGDTVNVITINGLKIELLNENQGIESLNLENAYPITDEEGLKKEPFRFRITNTTSRSLLYTLRIVSDTEKLKACTLEDGSPCLALSTDYIKYVYQKGTDGYTTPAILSHNDNIVVSSSIPAKSSIDSSLIFWIMSDAGNEIMNHSFYGKLVLEGTVTK